MHAPGLRLRRARIVLAIMRTIDVAFHSLNSVGTWDETVYGAQYWACMYPRALLHPTCYHDQRTTQGQRVWQRLRCKTLSFSTPSRFIPALSQALCSVFRLSVVSISFVAFCQWSMGIAVGTVVADGPPHRSVREAFPHTALAASRARNRSPG